MVEQLDNRPNKKLNKKVVLIVLALACATPLFFLGGPNWHSPDVFRNAWNQGHTLFFFLASWLLAQKIPLRRFWWQYLAALFVLSLAIETIQAQVGRSFSWLDISNNLLGAGFYLVWARPIWQRIIVMLPLLWQWGDIGVHGLAYYQQLSRFPMLADFQTSGQMRQWRGPIEISNEWASSDNNNGDASGKINFTTEKFSTAMLDDMPRDWRDYAAIQMMVNNPGDEPIRILVRLNDIAHIYIDKESEDRFRRHFTLEPGEQLISIDLDEVKNAPQDREMQMDQIQALMIFTISLPEPRSIYVDQIQLVKRR